MIDAAVLFDTGPLVALLDEDDQYHQSAVLQAEQLRGPNFTTWPIITEAAWLLRNIPNGLSRLLEFIESGDVSCLELSGESVRVIHEKAKKYVDLEPQLADLSLLYFAEMLPCKHIFTFDRRDFEVYQRGSAGRLILLPEVFP